MIGFLGMYVPIEKSSDTGEEFKIKAGCPACDSEDHYYERKSNEFHVLRCKNCDLSFSYPMPSDKELQELFSNAYEGKEDIAGLKDWENRAKYTEALIKSDKYDSFIELPAIKKSLEIINTLPKGSIVFDIGCATGDFIRKVKEMDYIPKGIDVAELPVKILRKYGFDLAVGTIEDVDYSPEVGAVSINRMIHHIPNPVSFITEVKTKFPNAVLLITSPSPFDWFRRGLDEQPEADNPPRHLTIGWTPKAFEELLKRSGYKHIEVIVLEPEPQEIHLRILDRLGITITPFNRLRVSFLPLMVKLKTMLLKSKARHWTEKGASSHLILAVAYPNYSTQKSIKKSIGNHLG